MANFKVVIVGAGVVGACCARTLARCGAEVLVVDQGEAVGVRGGTAAGMGHIVINDGDRAGLQLCKLGRSIWRDDCPEIAGADGFSETGTLWMAEDDDTFNELVNSAARLEAEGIRAELLIGKSFHDAEPALARDLVGGLRVPEDGVLYAPVVAAAMVDQAKQRGATFRPRVRVSSVESGVVRLFDGNSIEADAIVIASGLNALDLLDESGIEVPIVPREGQLAITARGTQVLSHHVVEAGYQKGAHGEVEEAVACAILPRSTGQLCIGSSRRPRHGAMVDRQLMERIIARSDRFLPGICRLPIVRCWSGTRAATADSRPLIGPVPAQPGVWIAAGFEGLGITQAPAAAQLIAHSMHGTTSPIDPRAWDPARVMTTS
jgi:glycine/D-amino acid oxidase-like deaminating enzyme